MMTTKSRLAADSGSSIAQLPNASRTSGGTFVKAILLVTAIAGALDIIAAHLHMWAATGRFPAALLKAIAGGALGRQRAMEGGASMMALGLFFHFAISFAFTLLFFLLFPRVALLRKNIIAVGTAYALFVWSVMNYIVLPLSALPWRAPNFSNIHTYIGCIVLIVIFGLPIALGAARFYKQQQQRS
jgi:hypothetical protein